MATVEQRVAGMVKVTAGIASCDSDCPFVIDAGSSFLGCSSAINCGASFVGINPLVDLDIDLDMLFTCLRIGRTRAESHHLQIDVTGREDGSSRSYQTFAKSYHHCCMVDDIMITKAVASHHDILQAL